MQQPDLLPDLLSDNNSFLFDLYSTPPPFQDPPINSQDSLISESPNNAVNEGNSNDHTQLPPSDSNTYLFDLFSTPPASQIFSEQEVSSLQDSQMGSPKSEEPTIPKIEQPEEIVVFPWSASNTPHIRSRPLSAASWTHAAEEEDSETNSPIKVVTPISNHTTNSSFCDATEGKLFPNPTEIEDNAGYNLQTDLSNPNLQSEISKFFYINNEELQQEMTREINQAMISYSHYYLNGPKLTLRPDHDFLLKQTQLQTVALIIIQALDSGTAMHPGETSNVFLTPQSWFRLTAAILAAINRGKLCSPSNAINGNKPLNTNDTFEIHKDLVHPLTEGSSVRHMALQLAKSFDTMHHNPLKQSPGEFYDTLIAFQKDILTKAATLEAKASFNPEEVHSDTCQQILNDTEAMSQIQLEVKNNIFQVVDEVLPVVVLVAVRWRP
ncbi:hypothetical protein EDB87DRAFT_1691692 [Lactarius vividus]|nr:hypothetical protein EDB87DRAFT_1691692 [Lactarius vividus]